MRRMIRRRSLLQLSRLVLRVRRRGPRRRGRPRASPRRRSPFWSTEARCAIVPAGPGGVFGAENFGNKFPGEAAVYMGIVHVAIYDAAVAIEGGYKPYAIAPTAPPAPRPRPRSRPRRTTRSPACSRSSAPPAGDPRRRLRRLPGCDPGRRGEDATGSRSARRSRAAVLALRANDGRGCRTRPSPTSACPPRARRLATRARAGARPLPARDAAARAPERLAVPARRPNSLTSQRVRRRTSTRSRTSAASTARARTAEQTNQACSGPTTTSGSGTTACSVSPPTGGSTSCRPPGCWRWRTSPAATR